MPIQRGIKKRPSGNPTRRGALIELEPMKLFKRGVTPTVSLCDVEDGRALEECANPLKRIRNPLMKG